MKLTEIKKELESELAKVNRQLRIDRIATKGITPNFLRWTEGNPFFAVGYRNDIYADGDWIVRFTPSKARAEEEAEAHMIRGGSNNPQTKIWQVHLEDTEAT